MSTYCKLVICCVFMSSFFCFFVVVCIFIFSEDVRRQSSSMSGYGQFGHYRDSENSLSSHSMEDLSPSGKDSNNHHQHHHHKAGSDGDRWRGKGKSAGEDRIGSATASRTASAQNSGKDNLSNLLKGSSGGRKDDDDDVEDELEDSRKAIKLMSFAGKIYSMLINRC